MTASDHLSVQFQHTQLPDMHQVSAHTEDGTQIGRLRWFASDKPDVAAEFFAQPGEVNNIKVDEQHRRKGVATGMWNHAKTLDPGIQHSGVQSGAGTSWSQAVGD